MLHLVTEFNWINIALPLNKTLKLGENFRAIGPKHDQQVLKEVLGQSETTTGASTCIVMQLNFNAKIGFDNITAVLMDSLADWSNIVQPLWVSEDCSISPFSKAVGPETFAGWTALTLNTKIGSGSLITFSSVKIKLN